MVHHQQVFDALLPPEQRHRIADAITAAERLTSGEICVHATPHCGDNVMDAAARTFDRLKLYCTERRNAVLIYVVYIDRKLAVLGDSGINDVVPDGYWDDIVARLSEALADGRAADGLCEAINDIGRKLATFFPANRNDVNELSNDVTYSDEEYD